MTLTEYCTGIANAIREAEGSTEPIPAPNHAARIRALSANGGSEYVEVTLTSYGTTIEYIDENGVKQAISSGSLTARVWRGVVGVNSSMSSATGDYLRLGPYTFIFKSDGGTLSMAP